ncbi:serpin family protein [Spirosoma montaniterrae]|uniref:Proteinase inhibitor I4 serpin n=1 Tax=Spirosoma montaniterrae TaxID=1178516 RepID=A0A1P9X1M1_9BACT|nr:serpin family protein [Spirosoma montaniterrae]AQG81495.1 proteinase inhibitor I4 serpin [Spirosoma montaniterrae]
MKTNSFLTTSTLLIASLLGAASCQNQLVGPGQPVGQVRVSAPFASQTTDFAFDFAKQVSQREGIAKNTFVSPLSLHMALGMILNGANSQTAEEIQKTLKLDAQTLADANATYQNLMTNLPAVDPKVTLALANSVWYRNTFQVATSFQDLLRESFKAEISAQNFDDPATVGNINGWASQKTNGKIPKVIDQISSDNVMFLMNALYFKGDWKTQFKPDETTDTPFTLASGATVNARMMRLNTKLRRAFKANYTAFELPYGSDKFAMTVLLPTPTTTADALIQSLSGNDWTQLQKDMAEGTIDIGLPKFTLNYEIKLNDALKAMGMPTAFTDRADFTKINPNGRLFLSFVKQNTFVAVDEKGTEAAAVTTGGISVTSMPASYICDRPFAFIIHEKTSGTVLFVGKIADPTQTAP